MVQNHMLQLLALTAMEPPATMGSLDIRNEKVQVLRAIRPMEPTQVARWTVRGQYGPCDDGPAYRQEAGVDPASQVETYTALKLFVDNWRWAGVPFYLRTGKRLASKASQVAIVFRREPLRMFTEAGCDLRGANRLVIRITPDEGINLVFDAKVPGQRMLLRPVKMDFQYQSAFESASPEAYEHLLLDALRGDQTLFIRADEVEASWRFIDSIRSAWAVSGQPPLLPYAAGSWGPDQADALFEDPYVRWTPT
jgi:glucose-6-phosphate 1-dehydrogenase